MLLVLLVGFHTVVGVLSISPALEKTVQTRAKDPYAWLQFGFLDLKRNHSRGVHPKKRCLHSPSTMWIIKT